MQHLFRDRVHIRPRQGSCMLVVVAWKGPQGEDPGIYPSEQGIPVEIPGLSLILI